VPNLKRKYLIENWESKFPKKGSETYVINGSIYLNTMSKTKKNFSRSIHINVKPKNNGGFSRTVELKTLSYELNLEPNSSSLMEILSLTSSIYDNVSLNVKHDGSILDIENELQIKQCWNIVKEKINKNYQGSSIRRFIRSIDYKLSSKKNIISNLSEYQFFGMIFNPIYKSHDSTMPFIINKNIRTSSGRVSVEENFIIDEVNDETNIVRLCIKGKLKSKEIDYSGYYEIDKKNAWIKNANIEIIEKTNNLNTFWLEKK